jgi:hypothetical protein
MSGAPCRIVSTRHGVARAAIVVHGRLDRAAIARLRDELACWRELGVVNVRVDLSDMSGAEVHLIWTLTSTLARMLAWARVQLRELGGDLTVSGADAVQAELDDAAARLGSDPCVQPEPPAQRYRPETADQP